MDEKRTTAAVGARAQGGGFATSGFLPILTASGDGHTFNMLGTTMRLLATAVGTGGRFTVFEHSRRLGSTTSHPFT